MQARFVGPGLAALVLTAAVGHATDARPAFVAQLERELMVGTQTTRVVFGSFIEYYDNSYRRTVRRRVDTEVYPGGQVRYQCVKGVFNTDWSPLLSLGSLLEKTFYVDPTKMKVLPQGSPVRVTGIDVKNDRLEVALDAQGRVPHVKLKLMLGKGLELQQTFDSAMETLSTAIVVESYEKVRQLQQAYAVVVRRLEETRALYAAVQPDAVLRLRAAEEHARVLQDAHRMCQELAATGRSQADAAKYDAERANVEEAMISLKEAGRVARLAAVNGSLLSMANEIDGQLSQLRTGTVPQGREQTVARLEDLVTKRDALLEERASLGQPATEKEKAHYAQDRQAISKAAAQMAAQKDAADRAQRLSQIEAAYSGMARSLSEAREGYGKAFGTPDQAGAARRLLSQLQQVYENRVAAGRAGSAQAAAQASELQKEIERMKRVAR